MTVLGIESSCDETAAAVVCDARTVRSNVVYSQTALHAPYGGVVPETASRAHLERLPVVIRTALRDAGCDWADLDVVAATAGPGLAGSLKVGFSAAKGLALRLDRPLVAVHHVEAHMLSVFLDPKAPDPAAVLPALALVVSGGHTVLYRVEGIGNYRLLGRSVDDAAGEAFDKAAVLLGLAYPGGPAVDRAAADTLPGRIRFPRGNLRAGNSALNGLRPELCWSFSGLKTALRTYLDAHPARDDAAVRQVAVDFRQAVVDALLSRCERALQEERSLWLGGGVAQNRCLRDRLDRWCRHRGIRFLPAPPAYCGDNAAMVAAVAGFGGGVRGRGALNMDVAPRYALEDSRHE